MKRKLTSVALAAMMLVYPVNRSWSDDGITPGPGVPDQNIYPVAGACIVAFIGLAAIGLYVATKSCQPKYYWLMDDDKPPRFWVGTATRKECQINGWKKIGGPYNRPEDAPPVHPDPTNRVDEVVSAPMNISVESSTNGVNWQTVQQSLCDPEDHVYFPTNTGAAFFRIKLGQ